MYLESNQYTFDPSIPIPYYLLICTFRCTLYISRHRHTTFQMSSSGPPAHQGARAQGEQGRFRAIQRFSERERENELHPVTAL